MSISYSNRTHSGTFLIYTGAEHLIPHSVFTHDRVGNLMSTSSDLREFFFYDL